MRCWKLIILLLLSFCAGGISADCDPNGLAQCLTVVSIELLSNIFDGFTAVCRIRMQLERQLGDCLRRWDCESLSQSMKQRLFDEQYQILDAVICDPTDECSVRNVLSCYSDLLMPLGVWPPPQNRERTANFIDRLPQAMYKNLTAYCSIAQGLDFELKAKCLMTQQENYHTTCIPSLPGSISTSRSYWTQALGPLGSTNPATLKTNVLSMCLPGCENYVERFESMKQCARHLSIGLVEAIEFSELTELEQIFCEEMVIFANCIMSSSQGCIALQSVSPSFNNTMEPCTLTQITNINTDLTATTYRPEKTSRKPDQKKPMDKYKDLSKPNTVNSSSRAHIGFLLALMLAASLKEGR